MILLFEVELARETQTLETHNAALRCERRLAILERSETAKRCESLLNALLALWLTSTYNLANQNVQHPTAYL